MHYLELELLDVLKGSGTTLAILDSCVDGLCFWDLEKPENEWISPGFWHTLGVNPESQKHLTANRRAFLFGGDCQTGLIDDSDSGLRRAHNCRYRHADGHIVHVRARRIPLGEKGTQRCLYAVTDVSREQEAARRFEDHGQLLQNIALFKSVQLQAILDTSPDAILGLDSDWRIAAWNRGAETMFDYTQGEILGSSILKLVVQQDQDRMRNLLSSVADQENHSVEMHGVRRDGTLFFFEVSLASLVSADGVTLGLAVTIVDVSARKVAETALARSEKSYRRLYNKTPVMYFSASPDGTIISVNDFGASQLGYHREDLLNQPVGMLFHEDDRGKAQENLVRCMESPGEVFDWELRKVRRDGRIIWVKETAWAVSDDLEGSFILIVCQDVTEKKSAAEALAASEIKFRTAFEMLPVGVAITGTKKRYVDLNDAFARLLGRSRETLLGPNPDGGLRFIKPDGRDFTPEEFITVRCLAENRPIFSVEAGIVREDGSLTWMLGDAHPLGIGDWGAVLVVRDITEQKRLQDDANLFRQMENERIGRELHDGLGGHLAGVRYLLDSLKPGMTQLADSVPIRTINHCSDLLSEGLVYIRTLARGFASQAEVKTDFETEMLRLSQNLETVFGVNLIPELDAEFRPAQEVSAQLIQIIREAINNAIRHGQARTIRITANGSLVQIDSDGIPMPERIEPGIGIVSMTNRAASIGAKLDLGRNDLGGTRVRLELSPADKGITV
ncbi:MAG: PAS domain S-box protein [Leptospirales bacterium]|nr:PAS domain S-box protein [Leptospirales bacterium]